MVWGPSISGCTLSLPALPNLTGASGLCHWVHFPNQTSLKLWTVHMSLSEASYRQGFNQLQSSFGVIQIFTSLCPVHPSAPHSPPCTPQSCRKTSAPRLLPPLPSTRTWSCLCCFQGRESCVLTCWQLHPGPGNASAFCVGVSQTRSVMAAGSPGLPGAGCAVPPGRCYTMLVPQLGC